MGNENKTPANGNAAAMRAALDKAKCVLLVAARFATDNAFTDAEARENLRAADWDGALAEIDAALAAPARNCDVGTEMEQHERFDAFCHNLLCGECPCSRVPDCGVAWANEPFAPEKGGAK